MGVSSYFEFISTLLGWVVYDNNYHVLADSGILYIPFIIIIVKHVIDSRKAGDDEGNAAAQSVKKIETDIVVTMFVVLVCVIPVADVSLGEMQYVKPALNCKLDQEALQGDNTETTTDFTLDTIGGETGRAPVWWAVIHMISKSVTAGFIAGLPCSYELSTVGVRLANEKIEDPAVRRELSQFISDCFSPAYAQFVYQGERSPIGEALEDIKWIGSEYLITNHYPSFYSSKPRFEFPFNPIRDAGFEGDQATGGHPLCNEWWQSSQGLRSKLLSSMTPETLDDMVYDGENLISISVRDALGIEEREDVFLRKYLAVQNVNRYIGGVSFGVNYDTTFADILKRSVAQDGLASTLTTGAQGIGPEFLKESAAAAAAAVGAVTQGPGHVLGGKVLRESVSFAQGLLLLMFIVFLPLLLVFSLYRLQYILTLSILLFAINFLSFVWGLGYWLDNNLTSMMMHGRGMLGVFTVVPNATQILSLVWMQRFLYIVLPFLWITMLGWVGYSAGRMMADMGATTNAGSSVAESGANKAVNVGVSAATKRL